MLKIELNQPVEPAGVETISPLDDCSSMLWLYDILYLAETCEEAPINKSLNARILCPSFSFASANLMVLDWKLLDITLSTPTIKLEVSKGNRTPSYLCLSGFTATMGIPFEYFAVFATNPS